MHIPPRNRNRYSIKIMATVHCLDDCLSWNAAEMTMNAKVGRQQSISVVSYHGSSLNCCCFSLQ